MNHINFKTIGLKESHLKEAEGYPDLVIARISSQYKNSYKVITENGERLAEVSGKFHFKVNEWSDYPAVGDFVLVNGVDKDETVIIHHVLSRQSVFGRKAAGETNDLQIVATNIDTVFICMALNNDFNLRRLERYLSIAWDSGANPVIVLTKADLCQDIPQMLAEVSSVGLGTAIHVTSSANDQGLDELVPYLSNGQTVAFIGSSGVGKSTLINHLAGQTIMETNDLRDDDKGRHTTTRRELIVVADKGVLIDTPGMREIGIVSADFSKSFSDIEELASQCKFNDCSHQTEPKCAVQAAIQAGSLSEERLASYRKLLKEAKYEGLNSRMIEKVKMNRIFSDFGGLKQGRQHIKEKNKRKR